MSSPSSSESARSEKPTLTDVLRARAAFIVEPVAGFLAAHGISPDTLTIVGMLAHFLLAWFVAGGRMQAAGIAIFFIAPLDAFDGALARKLGRQQGGFGAFLDSTLDRVAEIIFFGGFLFYYQGDPLMMATTYLAITGSIMVSYARARAEALDVPCKVGILSRVERYGVLTFALLINVPHVGLIVIAIFAYVTVAQRIFHVWQHTHKQS